MDQNVHFIQTQQKTSWISVFRAKNQHSNPTRHIDLKKEKKKKKPFNS